MDLMCSYCGKPITCGGTVACPMHDHSGVHMSHCYECRHGRDWLSGERRCGFYWDDKTALEIARKEATEKAIRAAREFSAQKNPVRSGQEREMSFAIDCKI